MPRFEMHPKINASMYKSINIMLYKFNLNLAILHWEHLLKFPIPARIVQF